MISLEKYGINESMSNEEKKRILQAKQIEILERIDIIEDEERRHRLEEELSVVEDAISMYFDSSQDEISGLKLDDGDNESFDDLKGENNKEIRREVTSVNRMGNISSFQDSASQYLTGSKKDYDIAMQFLEKAYELDPDDDYTLWLMGCCHWFKREYDKAIPFYENSYKQGNDDAPNSLGGLYFYLGMFDDAIEWCKKAVNLGSGRAAEIIKEIEGLSEIREVSRKASAGDIKACVCLGQLLEYGDDKSYSDRYILDYLNNGKRKVSEFGKTTSKNPYAALYWYKKALELPPKGEIIGETYYCLGELYRDSILRDKEPNAIQKASEYYQKGADSGNNKCLYALYILYSTQRYGNRDDKKAMTYLIKYADTGNPFACREVGNSYFKGTNILEKNYSKAIHYYTIIAEDNDKDGSVANSIGVCYYHNKQYVEALTWYQKAVDKGNNTAAANIAKLHRQENELEEAFSWFIRARNMGYREAEECINELRERGFLTQEDTDRIVKGRDVEKLKYLAESYETGTNGVPKDIIAAKKTYDIIKKAKVINTFSGIAALILGFIGGCVPLLMFFMENKATHNNLHRLASEAGVFKTIGIEILGLIVILVIGAVLSIFPSKFDKIIMIVSRIITTCIFISYAKNNTPSSPYGVISFQVIGTIITITVALLDIMISKNSEAN